MSILFRPTRQTTAWWIVRGVVFTLFIWIGLAACTTVEGILTGTNPGLSDVPASLANPTTTTTEQATSLPDPAAAAAAYLAAWEAGDYSAMYAWLSTLSRDAIPLSTFESTHRRLLNNMSLDYFEFTLLSAFARSESAQVSYRAQYHTILVGTIERTATMNLTAEGDQWRVQWDIKMILPELETGYSLWLDRRAPSRGNIYDVHGEALVAQADAVSLGLVVGDVDSAQENILLDEVFTLLGLHPDRVRAQMNAYRPDWYLPLGVVSSERAEARRAVLETLRGLVISPYRSRYYFNSGIAPQVIGYMSSIPANEVEAYQRLGYQQDARVGRMGLEAWAEPYLAGPNSGTLYVVTSEGKILTRLAEGSSQPAQSVYTTLDRALQMGTQAALTGFTGAIVVLERDTGRILAMASSPTFDPNIFEPANYNSSYLLTALLEDTTTPLLNRATQGQYPLGSVFKIITMAAALESGQFNVVNRYYCGHQFTEVPGLVRYDWTYQMGVAPSGMLNLTEALMRSCNPWFWHVGINLYTYDQPISVGSLQTEPLPSGEIVAEMARGFGLGSPTGIGQIVEANGNIPNPQNSIDAINLAIGQGDTLVTPLQVARFVAAIGNGGYLLRPQVVDRITLPGGSPSYIFEPEIQAVLPITTSTLAAIQEGLRTVVADTRGTAYWRFINFPIPLAGKTGTAESPPNAPHAWFAGYTMANQPEKPDIAIAVILEHAGEGSVVAAPVFKRIVELYFYGQALSQLPWELEVPTPPSSTETP